MDRCNIMFVDDDELIARMTSVTLRRLGHEAQVFCDSGAAVAAFREAPQLYDLVICDVRLGVDSGLEFARTVKEIDPQAPLLLVSGAVDQGDLERARALGAWGPMSKAEVMTDLAGAIERFAARSR